MTTLVRAEALQPGDWIEPYQTYVVAVEVDEHVVTIHCSNCRPITARVGAAVLTERDR